MFLKKKKDGGASLRYEPLVRCGEEGKIVPRDVPKGHLVVYVGEEQKRFIIQITILQHPLFQALLDQAQQEYGFSPNARLHIPCEERAFVTILRCIGAQQHKKLWLCF